MTQAPVCRLSSVVDKNKVLQFVATVLLAVWLPTIGNAQTNVLTNIDDTTSTPVPGVPHDYITGLNEVVNPADGSLSVRIKAPVPHERGVTWPLYAFTYDSNGIFTIVPNWGSVEIAGGAQVQPLDGFQTQNGVLGPQTIEEQSTIPSGNGTTVTYLCDVTTSGLFVDPDGGRHSLALELATPVTNYGNDCGHVGAANYLNGGDAQYKAVINAGTANITVVDNHGNVVFSEDSNGNQVKVVSSSSTSTGTSEVNQTSTGREQTFSTTINGITTTSDITIPGVYGPNGNAVSYQDVWSYAQRSSGVTIPFTVVSGNGAQCNVPSPTVTGGFKSSETLTLPNGETYQFTYDPATLLLSKIVYPTGAYVEYTWSVVPNQVGIQYVSPTEVTSCGFRYGWFAITKRQVSFDGSQVDEEQDFSYTTNWPATGTFTSYEWTSKSTKVTTIDEKTGKSFDTIYYYSPIAPPPSGTPQQSAAQHGLMPEEQTIRYYNDTTDQAASLLKTVTKSWQSISLVSGECETLPNGQTSGKFYTYQPYSGFASSEAPLNPEAGSTDLPTDVAEYDYGQVTTPCVRPASSIIPLRETETTYASFGTTPLFTFASILDRPSRIQVYGNVNGAQTLESETDFQYDGTALASVSAINHDDANFGTGNAVRGNPTLITKKCSLNGASCSSDSVTNYTYDITGQVLSSTDAKGNQTAYNYADNYTTDDGTSPGNTNAYVTKITQPSTSGVSHITQFKYGYNDGRLRSKVDENSLTTTFCYTSGGCGGSSFDPFFRLSGVEYPDGGQEKVAYNDAGPNPSMTSSVLQNSTTNLWMTTTTTYDAIGHAIKVVDPASYTTNTTYDGLERLWTVTNPFVSTSDPTYSVATTAYDALNRPLSVTYPDSTVSSNTYSSNTVVSTDPDGKKTQRTSDALGRLTQVIEDPSSSNFQTAYGYDALGDLTRVDQWGGTSGSSGDRLRTFHYDGLSRLLASTNPENGTLTYTYDANGNVLSKVDARGDGVWYCYDALNRVTGKAYTSQNCSGMSSPVATYAYDTSSISGASNDIGRLTSATAYNGSTVVAKTIPYAYNPMGRLLKEQECTPVNCSGTPYSLGYTYDVAGDVMSATNGASNDGISAAYLYDGASRLNNVSATTTWSDTNHPATLLNNAAYGPAGLVSANLAIDNATQEPGITMSRAYDTRLRINTETDTANNIVFPAGGSATLTINGSEQEKGSTSATGSVTIGGIEQNKQTSAATGSTGSISISGSEQSFTGTGKSGTGSVTISGADQVIYQQVLCGPPGSGTYCQEPLYVDTGIVEVIIGGTGYEANYGGASETASEVASSLVTAINSGSLATATLNGSSITITAKATGTASNYSLSASSWTTNTAHFSSPSFSAATSGSALTGGAAGPTTYNSGTVTATLDGCSGSTSYGQSSSTSNIASGLASALTSSCGSIVSASASGSTVSVTSKATGTGVNWQLTSSVSYNSSQFSSASFGASASGMGGGKNAVVVYDSGTVVAKVNGYAKSVSFGQSDTTSTIASKLVTAINGDSSEPVTATGSGATVALKTKQTGSTVNYSLSASDTYDSTDFSKSSFTGTVSGAALTGGTGSSASSFYDSGTVSLTINGTKETVSYAQGDTAASVASKLVSAFAGDTAVSMTTSGAALQVASATTGTATDYSYSFAETHSSDFTNPSFSGSPASGSLAGGTVGGSGTPTTVYSYSIPAYSSSTPSSSGYDADGNVVSFNDSVMGSWTYGYDNLNRVTSGVASSGPYPGYSDCFAYDPWGNRTGEAFSTTACGSSPTPTSWANYNGNNQITATGLMPAGYGYDAAGNVLNDGVNQYLYDNEERVCAVYDPTTGAMTGYVYDANGDRVAKGALTSFSCNMASNGFSLTTSYALDKDGHEVSVFNGSSWQYSNIYAAGRLLATYTNSPSEVDFPLTDWLGTKRVVLRPNGNIANCWTSLAYGNLLSPCGVGSESDPTNLHFTGKERDSESGNDYFGARYYAPAMGRFMSPDWAGKAEAVPYAEFTTPQSLNLYGYEGNNPLGGVDQDGHCDWCYRFLTNIAEKVGTFTAAHPDIGEAMDKLASSLGIKGTIGVGGNVDVGSIKVEINASVYVSSSADEGLGAGLEGTSDVSLGGLGSEMNGTLPVLQDGDLTNPFSNFTTGASGAVVGERGEGSAFGTVDQKEMTAGGTYGEGLTAGAEISAGVNQAEAVMQAIGSAIVQETKQFVEDLQFSSKCTASGCEMQ